MWRSESISLLANCASVLDRDGAAAHVQALVQHLLGGSPAPDEAEQRQIFASLRRARWFELMLRAAEALSARNAASCTTMRQHAQALIEQDLFDEALLLLERVSQRPDCPSGEQAEATGLIGRVYKQLYVDRFGVLGPMRRSTLQSAIAAYHRGYSLDRQEYTWHGINAVALLLRGERDGIIIDVGAPPAKMAEDILAVTQARRLHWDLTTAAEACIALGRWDEAERYLEEYVAHPDLDSFSCASTLRQLKQVWQLREEDAHGQLLTILQPAVLQGSQDASRPVPQRMGPGLALRVGELTPAFQRAQEKVFGGAGPRLYAWYCRGIDRARSVARIESELGDGVGTGFLVSGAQLFPALAGSEELVLVTNAHVLGQTDPQALRAEDAIIRFEAVDTARRLRVREILFESNPSELDVTIVRLDGAVTGVEPCPIGPREEPELAGGVSRRFYVIGHPLGGGLSLSIDDNLQVGWAKPKLHYRTATEPGSSGSPVFDDAWRVVALHHAGSAVMPRLDGDGVYEANEGIWIHSILDAIRTSGSARARAIESTSAPVRPAFRNSIFISYAHADVEWLERLSLFLKPLAKDVGLDVWDDRRIAAGGNWRAEIERQLDSASVAILLVSQHFLSSDFIGSSELPRLLEASRSRGLSIIPIAISASLYKRHAELCALQFANDPAQPLDLLPNAQCQVALVDIAERIGRVLDVARLSNPLLAIDAATFKASGMGGSAATAPGAKAFAARTAQQQNDIVLKTGDQALSVVKWSEISQLDPQCRKLIAAFDKAIQDLYDRWTEEWPHRSTSDATRRQLAEIRLLDIRRELCGQFNGLLDFFQAQGWALHDHYQGVRYICSKQLGG